MVIYKITNKVNQKIYIGKTVVNSADRWQRHIYESFNKNNPAYNFPLHRAIRKYGKENFVIEDIEAVENTDELNIKERYWINFYKNQLGSKMIYNIAEGGNGGRTRGTGWHHTVEAKEKMSKNHNYNSNKNRPAQTEEAKKKIGDANKGKKNGMYGKHHTEESRKLIGKASTERQLGKKLSKEHKQKLSASHLGIARGKVAIHKDGLVKYILPEQVTEFLKSGWLKGTGRFKK